MIKVYRDLYSIEVAYTNDIGETRRAYMDCSSTDDAKKIVSLIKLAINHGYGFAKCIAILEGDREINYTDNLYGHMDTDGIEVWAEDGKIIIADEATRQEYPDTAFNRKMAIREAKAIIKEWKAGR